MTEIKYYNYRPLGAAREFFRRRNPEIILSGPAGTGKSRVVLERLNAVAEKYAGCRLLVVRKTRASLTNTGIITFKSLVLPPGNAELTYQQAAYPNGSIIDWGGMDKASKIMSSEYDIIAALEATELTEEDWEALSTRLRWGKLPYQILVGDCNPGAPTHWIKRRESAGKLVLLESRHEDNPVIWDQVNNCPTAVGAAYLSKLDALTGVRYLRLRKGIWAAAEGMVYDEYDPRVHLIDRFDVPASWPRAWVVDFGFTNPFVLQIWAADPDGRLYLIREFYHTKRIVEDHCVVIKAKVAEWGEPRPSVIVCDHDAEDRATFERHCGMKTIPAYKAVTPGIQAVKRRLAKAGDGRPRLMILRDSVAEIDSDLADRKLPTCTAEEIECYVWPKTKPKPSTEPQGAVKEQPVKENDHGMDAARYIVANVDRIWRDPSREFQLPPPGDPYRISPI